MGGYSPAVEDGWTAPKESGFSAEDQIQKSMEAEENIHTPEDENHLKNDDMSFEMDHQEHEEAPSHNRRKKKNPFQKRIDQLVYEKGAVEQNNAFLAQQLAEKEAYLAQQQARMQQYEEQMSQKDQYANEYFENSLDTQERDLKNRIKAAKEEGDVDNEIEYIDQLAEIKATKTSHAAWKVQEQARKYKEAQEEEYVPYETQIQNPYQHQSPQQVEFNDWVNENSWYRQPKLKQEADMIADELSNILTFNNQSHVIGTPEFRDSVTNVMRERYGVKTKSPQPQEESYEEDYEEEAYQPMHHQQRPSAVAPVTRRSAGGTMAQDYMSTRGNQGAGRALSKLEYELARHLPVKSNKEGEMDLIRRYQKAKAYPKSPLPGGSPNRLTIL